MPASICGKCMSGCEHSDSARPVPEQALISEGGPRRVLRAQCSTGKPAACSLPAAQRH